MLKPGTYAAELKQFILQVNQMSQEDAEKAIEAHCRKQEELIYNAIKSLTITIPPSAIMVAGSAAAQTNPAPIVLTGVIS